MPFIFSAVELCVVTINEKPWTRAKEVCKALEYSKASKTEDIVKRLCSQENFTHKCQLIGFVSETKPVNWPKDSQKYDIYINEEGMYELLFSSQQPKAKNFRKHCYNVMFPQIRQQLTNKLKEDHQQAINQIQALEFTNEEERQAHEQGILRLTEEINDLIANRHVARRGCFDNVLCFIKKNRKGVHPYSVIRCQYKQLEKHKRWIKLRYPSMEVADKCDDRNAIHRWCRFKREVIKKPIYYKNHSNLTEEK